MTTTSTIDLTHLTPASRQLFINSYLNSFVANANEALKVAHRTLGSHFTADFSARLSTQSRKRAFEGAVHAAFTPKQPVLIRQGQRAKQPPRISISAARKQRIALRRAA